MASNLTITSIEAPVNQDNRKSAMNVTYGYTCWNLPEDPIKRSEYPNA